jgi:hypothetical protein
MRHEKRRPAALAGAHRAENVKALEGTFDGPETSADPLAFQAAVIGLRYRLSPCLARLVCHLAQIGGRLA